MSETEMFLEAKSWFYRYLLDACQILEKTSMKYLQSVVRGLVFQITDLTNISCHTKLIRNNLLFLAFSKYIFSSGVRLAVYWKSVHGILLESSSGNVIRRKSGFFVSPWHGRPLRQSENSPLVWRHQFLQRIPYSEEGKAYQYIAYMLNLFILKLALPILFFSLVGDWLKGERANMSD